MHIARCFNMYVNLCKALPIIMVLFCSCFSYLKMKIDGMETPDKPLVISGLYIYILSRLDANQKLIPNFGQCLMLNVNYG